MLNLSNWTPCYIKTPQGHCGTKVPRLNMCRSIMSLNKITHQFCGNYPFSQWKKATNWAEVLVCVCVCGADDVLYGYYKGSQGVPRMRNVREWWNLPNQPRNRFFPYSPQMFQSLFRTWNSSVFMLHFTFSEKTESGPVIPKLHSLAINNINSWLNRFLKLWPPCNSYNKINGFLNLCPPAWKSIYQNK